MLAVVAIVLNVTPWPSALLIRAVFQQNAASTVAEMQRHQPTEAITENLGVAYGSGTNETMDVFTTRPGQTQPTVVWVHGGAWISGSAANVDPYLRILAAEGYTTIGINYTVGPEGTYPTAIHQVSTALAYIQTHATDLGVDDSRIVLAGDSAGSQIASQIATLATNPEYAEILGISPTLRAEHLKGVVLNCGVYDMDAMSRLEGLIGWGFKIALWAYTGTKNWSSTYEGTTMSTIDWVTADFPPTFITGGNGDGLTWLESIPFAARLQSFEVDTDTLFWPADHTPALPHEYQFHLDTPEAQKALAETIAFLNRVTG